MSFAFSIRKVVAGVIVLNALAGCGGSGAGGGTPATVGPAAYRSMGLGVDIRQSIASDAEWDLLASGGFGLVRFNMHWYSIEKVPGVYNFKQNGQDYDALVDAMGRRGIRMSFHLAYENINYDHGFAPHTATGRAAFARFAAACAARYRGKGIVWEIWNEPNIEQFWKRDPSDPTPIPEQVAKLTAVTVKAMKQADPSAFVVGPSVGPLDRDDVLEYVNALGKEGALALLDGVSVHPYPSHQPEEALLDYDLVRSAIRRWVPEGKPLYNTETGRSTGVYDATTQLTEDDQADWLVRSYLVDLMAGVELSLWYNWKEAGSEPNDLLTNFGTVTADLIPKPAFRAAATVTEFLRGYPLAEILDNGATGIFTLRFEKNGDSRIAIWRADSSRNLPTFHLPPGTWHAVDTYGRAAGIYSGDNQVGDLGLTGSPLFLRR